MKLRCLTVFAVVAALSQESLRANEAPESLPVIYADDFEHGMNRWETTDPDPGQGVWNIAEIIGPHGKPSRVLRVGGSSKYQPRFRSPFSIAWLKGISVGDFEMTVWVQSTNKSAGGHRDMCLFWGRKDADHFYYVHLGAQADPAACQIFIVNGAPRAPITLKKAKGTPWDDGWRRVKVIRRTADGTVAVYFDDMSEPLMTAQDKTFVSGGVGLGTFDDHGNWDDFELRGTAIEVKK